MAQSQRPSDGAVEPNNRARVSAPHYPAYRPEFELRYALLVRCNALGTPRNYQTHVALRLVLLQSTLLSLLDPSPRAYHAHLRQRPP